MVRVAGAAALLLRLALRRRHLLVQAASGRRCPQLSIVTSYRFARQLGIARLPDVRESSFVEAPLALGIRRPLILLPSRLSRRADQRSTSRRVIAHELTHHHHRDLLADALVSVACALWWFHPLVWLLAAQFRELREERCDDRVIGLGIDPRTSIAGRSLTWLPSTSRAWRGDALGGYFVGRRFARILRGRRAPRILLIGGAAVVLVFATTALPHTTRPRDTGLDPLSFGSDPRSVVDVHSLVRRTVSVRVETSTPRR